MKAITEALLLHSASPTGVGSGKENHADARSVRFICALNAAV
jgi:hypothetical protein